jgi:uncharacterized membrane protein (DUF485 family)
METFFTVVFMCFAAVKLIKQFVVTCIYGRKASVPYTLLASAILENDKMK